jgi:CelD/BcsL family acetyltransferase involved in cellulose biosynthesis
MGHSCAITRDFVVYQGLEGLENLRECWAELFNKVPEPTYYQDWRWIFALLTHLIEDPVYFVTLRKQGRTVMILPLQLRLEKKAGFRKRFLSFLSHNHIVLSDSLVDVDKLDHDDMPRLLGFLTSQSEFKWSYIQLKGLCENSQLYQLLKKSGMKCELISHSAYFDWPEGSYDKTLSKKFIKNIRRLGNRAERETGSSQIEYVSAPDRLRDAYETFTQLEASGWKGENGTSTAIKHDEKLISFYRHLIESFSVDGSCQINILRLGGEPTAAQLCIKTGSSWYILKIAFSENYKQYGVGNLLMLNFLEHVSLEADTTELCLVTSPLWADRWHLKKRGVYMINHYNSNLTGRLSRTVKNSKKKLKVLIK